MWKNIILVVALISLALFLPKLVNLQGGLILGEPDEFVHVELVKSLLAHGWPIYRGVGFYFDLPAYFIVAAFFSSIFFHNPLVSLRYLSLLSAVATSFLIFYYLRQKVGTRVGLAGMFLYFLIPLTNFYLRLGVIEPFLLVSLTGAAVFFDLALERKSLRFSALSGIFMALGVVTKYSVLPLLVSVGVFFVAKFLSENRFFLKRKEIQVNKITLLPLFEAGLICVPIFLYFYTHDPLNFKWQAKQIFGLTGEVHQELRLARFLDFPWWFSWPVLVLVLIGLFKSGREFKRYRFFLISFSIFVIAILSRLPFYPRYLLPLLPFLAIFAAQGLSLIKDGRLTASLLILISALNFSFLTEAYRSSYQTISERAVKGVEDRRFAAAWVFSNYWPNYFADFLGVKNYSWLTLSVPDIDGFAKGEQRDSLSILEQEGGVVFLEKTYADLYITQSKSRLLAINKLRGEAPPAFSVQSQSSNFPFSHNPGNQIDVYLVKPKKLL